MSKNNENFSNKMIDKIIKNANSEVAFVHVPKTGGTYLSIPSVPKKFGAKLSNLPGDIHIPVSKIEMLTNNNSPLFTLVRDPYDRVCSEYYHIIKRIKMKKILSYWDDNSLQKVEFLARREVTITKNKNSYEKIYNIFYNKMSIEEYLEWSEKKSEYLYYYDTKTPKDFDIVGITENIENTIRLLKIVYNSDAGGGNYNKNIDKKVGEPYETKYPRSYFKLKNKVEYDIYDEAKQRFNELVKKYL